MSVRNIAIFFLLLEFSLSFADKDASISVVANPSAVRIGDRIFFTISVDYPESAKVGILAKPDSMLGNFNVLSIAIDSAGKVDGHFRQKINYELSYFGLSDDFIPPIGVLVIYPDSTADTIFTQPVRVSFISLLGDVPPDSAEIRDIKPPMALSYNYRKLALNILLGIILVAVVLGYLWYRSRKKRGLGIFEFISPKKTPWELAIMKLNALSESELLGKGNFKEYFDQLTDILREYIEGRFGIAALELSTYETMENLRNANLGLDSTLEAFFVDKTEELLRRADLIKFAKFLPDPHTALQDWEMVRKLIVRTIPKQEEEQSEKAETTKMPHIGKDDVNEISNEEVK